MIHKTTQEWKTTVGQYNQTQMVLRTYDTAYEFVICDHVDSHQKFWTGTTLDNLEQIAASITELVKAARSKA